MFIQLRDGLGIDDEGESHRPDSSYVPGAYMNDESWENFSSTRVPSGGGLRHYCAPIRSGSKSILGPISGIVGGARVTFMSGEPDSREAYPEQTAGLLLRDPGEDFVGTGMLPDLAAIEEGSLSAGVLLLDRTPRGFSGDSFYSAPLAEDMQRNPRGK